MNLSTLRSFAAAALLGASALLCSLSAQAADTMVRVHTNVGPIDITLFNEQAPKTVANFLAYVRSGAYSGTVIHRSIPGFITQAGGYAKADSGALPHIPTNPPVVNEFSSARSNLRATVAMAKLGGNPDSATSEWFVNLANNAANLDNQNGGFTVFGRVSTPGMVVVDKIAALPRFNATNLLGSAFTDVPSTDSAPTASTLRKALVVVSKVTEFPPLAQQTDSDRIFNFLEAAYPAYLAPSGASGNGVFEGFTYRYYADSPAYLATKDGKVFYLAAVVGASLLDLGSVSDWLANAQAAGY